MPSSMTKCARAKAGSPAFGVSGMVSGCSNLARIAAGKLRQQAVALDDAAGVGDGGGVGQRRAGSQCGFAAFGHVGDAEAEFHGGGRGGGQAPAFHGGEMLAHGVHFVDGRAAKDEQAVKLLQIGERDARIER